MNITEFAQLAGVSKAAVSRYFNGGYLSAEKKAQIEAAIAQTGYHPSATAQTLRTGQTRQVGVVLPSLGSERCAQMTEGMAPVLEQAGYQLLLLPCAGDHRREAAALELLQQGRVDGLLFIATTFSREHRQILDVLKAPIVLLGQQYPGQSSISHDDLGAAKAMTRLLLNQGRTIPAFIGVTLQDRAAGAARRRGFEEAVREAELTVPQARMLFAQSTMESGFQQARRLFTQPGPRPDCLLCATDAVALGAMEYCRSAGLQIPEDVMVASIGDSRPGRTAGLTSAHLHDRTAGRRAAALLLEQLQDPKASPRSEVLGFECCPRATTGSLEPLDPKYFWTD